MPKRWRLPGAVLATFIGMLETAPAAVAPTNAQCELRSNATAAALTECIATAGLWRHLVALQAISDLNPGADGHGNRDTGTAGYAASVEYVARYVRNAGYKVSVQTYTVPALRLSAAPVLSVSTSARPHAASAPALSLVWTQDWHVASQSGVGDVTRPVQPLAGSGDGCGAGDFDGFVAGNVALIRHGSCGFDESIMRAQEAGAAAIILSNAHGDAAEKHRRARSGVPYLARLTTPASVPVIGAVSSGTDAVLREQFAQGLAPVAHITVQGQRVGIEDYNLIADSPYGDPNSVVVVDAHLDSIFGAGILDNGSGSATILEIALKLAHTRTRHQLRYIWFGGEELGLYGSAYYTSSLSAAERKRISFDIDVDVTGTPNYDILIADPAFAPNVRKFPPGVVARSKVGNAAMAAYFQANNMPIRSADFGNDGTDSNSFSLIGIPNTGILTQQDCCKAAWEVAIWGGFPGNYEGNIPSNDGGCVDNPNLWCDNITNVRAPILQLVSKGTAAAILRIANENLVPQQTRDEGK